MIIRIYTNEDTLLDTIDLNDDIFDAQVREYFLGFLLEVLECSAIMESDIKEDK